MSPSRESTTKKRPVRKGSANPHAEARLSGIHRALAERLNQGAAGVQRLRPSTAIVERDRRQFETHIGAAFRPMSDELRRDIEIIGELPIARVAERPIISGKAQERLSEHFLAQALTNADQVMGPLNVPIPSGVRVLSPPYDIEWTTGNGFAVRRSDKFYVAAAKGFCAAGLGFYLDSSQLLSAAVTPIGRYAIHIHNFDEPVYPAYLSTGLGMTVYRAGDPAPLVDKRVRLSYYTWLPTGTHDTRSGTLQDAAAPASGFGSARLAPAYFTMNPGESYLVWVYAWMLSAVARGPWAALLFAEMPLVAVDAGTPILVW